jgi:hypothetical protein
MWFDINIEYGVTSRLQIRLRQILCIIIQK